MEGALTSAMLPLPADMFASGLAEGLGHQMPIQHAPALQGAPVLAGESDDGSPAPSGRSRRDDSEREELKRLYDETLSLNRGQLARRVREDESTQNAERSRQLFGMKWLTEDWQRVDDPSAAVPRNAVYNRYVRVCATEKIRALNPASFGKLVRIVFPNIKTRRLGVRGHSKYHYCGIRYSGGDQPHGAATDGPSGNNMGSLLDNEIRPINNVPGTVMAVAQMSAANHIPEHDPITSPVGTYLQQKSTFVKVPLAEEDHRLILPPIEHFAPNGTSERTMKSLQEAYFSYSIQRIQLTRFMKLKKFYEQTTIFLAKLNDSEYALFTDPCMAKWVEECDMATYQIIIQLVRPLSLEAAPHNIVMALRSMSTNLCASIAADCARAQVPARTSNAMDVPARIFTSLLNRLLRVNEAGHAAGRILLHRPDCEIMKNDWLQLVKTQAIVDREVFCFPRVVQEILDNEIRDLMTEDYINPTRNCFDRWAEFLGRIPKRFSGVSPRIVIMVFDCVASAALRDMTMGGGDSFGGWWVVKCWADEYLRWEAEANGFTNHRYDPTQDTQLASTQGSDNDEDADDSAISMTGVFGLNGSSSA